MFACEKSVSKRANKNRKRPRMTHLQELLTLRAIENKAKEAVTRWLHNLLNIYNSENMLNIFNSENLLNSILNYLQN